MNYIFMGFLYDKTTEKKLLRCSKSGLQTAPNQYQMGLIGGLESLLEEKISIISSYPVGSFPLKNKKLFYRKSMARISAYSSIRYTGFVNFYILREIIRAGKMFKNVLRLLDCNDTNIVLVYGLELAFAEVIKKLKAPSTQLPEKLKLQHNLEAQKVLDLKS